MRSQLLRFLLFGSDSNMQRMFNPIIIFSFFVTSYLHTPTWPWQVPRLNAKPASPQTLSNVPRPSSEFQKEDLRRSAWDYTPSDRLHTEVESQTWNDLPESKVTKENTSTQSLQRRCSQDSLFYSALFSPSISSPS